MFKRTRVKFVELTGNDCCPIAELKAFHLFHYISILPLFPYWKQNGDLAQNGQKQPFWCRIPQEFHFGALHRIVISE